MISRGFGLRVGPVVGSSSSSTGAVTQQRPGDGDAPLLAAGQSVAMLADRRVIAVWKVIGEGRDAGPFGGLPELPGSRTRPAVADVLRYCPVVQPRLLRDQGDQGAEPGEREPGDVPAVDGDPACLRVGEPDKQRKQRRLPGAGRSGERCQRRPGKVQGRRVEHRRAGAVRVAHPVQNDLGPVRSANRMAGDAPPRDRRQQADGVCCCFGRSAGLRRCVVAVDSLRA